VLDVMAANLCSRARAATLRAAARLIKTGIEHIFFPEIHAGVLSLGR